MTNNCKLLKIFLTGQQRFDPDQPFPLLLGTRINLVNWEQDRYLNSHAVAAPLSKTKQEVTGYV